MSEQWYISRQGERYGPYSEEQLRGFAQSGQVTPEDLVWGDTMDDWCKAAEVEGLFNAPPAVDIAPPPAPPAVGTGLQYQAPAPATVQPAAGGEQIVGIIPGIRRKTGLFSSKIYSLVITERRIVFAEMTSQMVNQAAKDAVAEAKEQGKGFFGRALDTMKSTQRIYQKYWQMKPEEILAETPGNYILELRDIASVKIRHGMYHEEQGQYDKDELHIKTTRERIKLTFEYSNSGEAKKVLRGLLGKIVR